MSRRSGQAFRCGELEELTRQLHFAPEAVRVEQLRRAEQLHDQIDPTAAYPYDFIAYRITRHRRADASDDAVLLVGEAVLPDLRLVIDALSRSVNLRFEDEPAETAEQLAQRLNVSTKTLTRWRALGLRWRWVLPAGGKRRVLVYPAQAVERFVAAHRERVDKAGQFSTIDRDDRRKLIERARRMLEKEPGLSLNQVATQLAQQCGRALETLRLILAQHDREHPEQAVFADRAGPLSSRDRRLIARAHRMGVCVPRIAARFRRSPSTIYRAIHDRRAAALQRMGITFVASPIFARDDADAVIRREDLQAPAASAMSGVPVHDLPQSLRPLYRQPVLSPEAQRALLVRFNYCKFKAKTLRDQLDRYEPRATDLDAIEAMLREARLIRDRLVMSHLPTVLSVVRHHLLGRPTATPGTAGDLVGLLEVGNQTLIDAVEAFDFTRAQSFEAFLTYMLMRRLASQATAPRRAHRRLSGVQALQRLRDKAGESGVALDLGPEP